MIPSLQKFGDRSWTQDKLERIRQYLVAYSKIMAKRRYPYTYIDAFAGTGYHELGRESVDGVSLFESVDTPEVEAFLEGSARIALQVVPRFSSYIFIEKSRRKATELEKLREEFADKADDISIEVADANVYLQDLCSKCSWKDRRAVIFIDPFGLQLTWDTVTAIGNTKAIDTWILFPVSAVNRLLKNDGNIPPSWRQRLDTMFGESAWFEAFFPVDKAQKLFDNEIVTRTKVAKMEVIGKYFNERLSTVFAGVAPNPYTLRNNQGAPLFLLCFAAANPYAVDTAVKIADYILKRDPAPTLFD